MSSSRADEASASSQFPGYPAAGALDGNRFAAVAGAAWRAAPGQSNGWWQVRFEAPRDVGTILQILGDHEFVLENAPLAYVWQASEDGLHWRDLAETRVVREERTFRIHRLKPIRKVRFLRLRIDQVRGNEAVLREVEFFADRRAVVPFPDWMIVVNTEEAPKIPGHGREFIPLARQAKGWSHLQAQQVWLGSFDEPFATAEPRPLCAFLSGNFRDWCEVSREPWRGLQAVLKRGRLPIWASCGGAQGLAILAETGVDRPWDCPHCRVPGNPRLPIYGHIGHTSRQPCGNYSGCVHERGPHRVRQLGQDPVFAGLPEEFIVMESHCGQIEWPPKRWRQIATAGNGTLTRMQCLRVANRPIYAAQFHIEMAGTPETSQRIMSNFLELAKRAGAGVKNK